MASRNGTSASALTLSSDEVNYLVYRYMQESGFHHAAFTFAHESQVHRTDVDPNLVPAGALVAFIQKGMQYMEMEANVEDGAVEGEFAMLSPKELMTKDIDELRALVAERREKGSERAAAFARGGSGGGASGRKRERAGSKDERQDQQQQQQQQRQKQQQGKDKEGGGAHGNGPAPMDEDGGGGGGKGGGAGAAAPVSSVELGEVVTLKGHDGEVFVCAFSPAGPFAASGSGDATARIWDLSAAPPSSRVLDHPPAGGGAAKGKDVTTLEWSPDGSLLATGAYDGVARVWSRDGALKATLARHTGPVFALRWSRRGDLLLTSSADGTSVVWDAAAGAAREVFSFDGAVMDSDWRGAGSFAACTSDNAIHLCKLHGGGGQAGGGQAGGKPVRTWTGHASEVNAVRWDPSGQLLASCSDDATAKIWSPAQAAPVATLAAHEKEVYTLKWAPAGKGSANPSLPSMLATASFDGTARIWDGATGACLHTLRGPAGGAGGAGGDDHGVYAVAWAPSARLLATGSIDGAVRVWSVATGRLLRSYNAGGGVFDVAFDRTGTKLAVSTNAKVVHVLDLKY